MAEGKNHKVVQGEYLSGIARRYGFASYKTIWDAPENKDLKEKRKNPNILFPGDTLFIPAKATKDEARPTEQKHRFERESDPLHLRIVLLGLDKKPLSGHECALVVEGERAEITTKADGKLEKKEIPADATQGKLFDAGKRGGPQPRTVREIPLKIGHLDPVEEVSGQIARLNNLGYDAGDPGAPPGAPAEEDVNFQQFKSAVEEFQCDFGLKVDGICGPETERKLKEAHGC